MSLVWLSDVGGLFDFGLYKKLSNHLVSVRKICIFFVTRLLSAAIIIET